MKAVILIALLEGLLMAQSPSPWTSLKPLEGAWEGASKGEPGVGRAERRYEFIMGGRYLHLKNAGVYPPSEKNPKGERHEDWGFFSYDRSRKCFVYRQFHIEGFVNQYACPVPAGDPVALVCTSEAIENIPPGWKARETLRIVGPDEITEVFELAAPGKEFSVYAESRLKRKK